MTMWRTKKRNERIAEAIRSYTARVTESRETARAALVAEGIYNEDDTLREGFGG